MARTSNSSIFLNRSYIFELFPLNELKLEWKPCVHSIVSSPWRDILNFDNFRGHIYIWLDDIPDYGIATKRN